MAARIAVASFASLALEARPMARTIRGHVPFRGKASASEALPLLRHARGVEGNAVSSMRHKHDFLACGGESLAGPTASFQCTGHLFHPELLLPPLRHQPLTNTSHGSFEQPVWRNTGNVDGHWKC